MPATESDQSVAVIPTPKVLGTRRYRVLRGRVSFLELDTAALKVYFEDLLLQIGRLRLLDQLRQMQAAVYTMCQGGEMGRAAADHPGSFYIDERTGESPYPDDMILQFTKGMTVLCEVLKLDPKNLMDQPTKLFVELMRSTTYTPPASYADFHNLGLFM